VLELHLPRGHGRPAARHATRAIVRIRRVSRSFKQFLAIACARNEKDEELRQSGLRRGDEILDGTSFAN